MNSNAKLKIVLATLAAVAAAAPQLAAAAAVALPADVSTWTTLGVSGTSGANGDIPLSSLPNGFGSDQFGYVTTAGSNALGASFVAAERTIQTNGSRITSTAFAASAGDTLGAAFNYITTDNQNFADFGWARIINAASNPNNPTTVAWLFVAQGSQRNSGAVIPGAVGQGFAAFNPDTTIANFSSFNFNNDATNFSPLGAYSGLCFDTRANNCGNTGWLKSNYTFAATGSYKLEIGVANVNDRLFDSALAFDFAGLTPAVPEPSTYLLMLAGLAAVGGIARRKRAAA